MDAKEVRDVVVLGASAGGVEALTALVGALPPDLAASVLVVQHLSPSYPSQLDSILRTVTRMPVVAAAGGEALRYGTVYVARTDRHLMVADSKVRVTRGPKECRARPSIDVLFRSAAVAHGPRVIGVILSGALDDGTAGLWAVKDHGGLAMVQEPSQAAHSSMPRNAIEHVAIDFVGSVEEIVRELIRQVGTPAGTRPASPHARMHEMETRIALNASDTPKTGIMLGPPSVYSCPECHGVLAEIAEGSVRRYRCHAGHAYSHDSLLADIEMAIDRSLWDTIRSVEERVRLLNELADHAEAAGQGARAQRCRALANRSTAELVPIRDMVMGTHVVEGAEPQA